MIVYGVILHFKQKGIKYTEVGNSAQRGNRTTCSKTQFSFVQDRNGGVALNRKVF